MLTTCSAILNTIDSRSNIEGYNPLFLMGKFFSKTIVLKNLFWATTAFFIGAYLTSAE